MIQDKDNSNLIPINKRGIGACILLSIITFGIYYLYWEYLLVKNVKAIKKDDSDCKGEMLCLSFVPFYFLFWWFTRGKVVKDEFEKNGCSASGNENTYLILGIFGLVVVSMAIMQNDFNSLPPELTQSIEPRPIDRKAVALCALTVVGLVLVIVGFFSNFIKAEGSLLGMSWSPSFYRLADLDNSVDWFDATNVFGWVTLILAIAVIILFAVVKVIGLQRLNMVLALVGCLTVFAAILVFVFAIVMASKNSVEAIGGLAASQMTISAGPILMLVGGLLAGGAAAASGKI